MLTSSMWGCARLYLAASLARAATDHNLVPLIVLKNPRSGSSWLVQLLNGVPSAFVTEEILTSKSAGHGDVKAEGEAHLFRALSEPISRFGRGAAFGVDEKRGGSAKLVAKDRAMRESGRRPRDAWDVVGFTVSPKRILGLNLFGAPDGVFWRSGCRKVVLYERTNKTGQDKSDSSSLQHENKIKQALAYARGRLLRDKCGMNNVRKTGKKACAIGKTLALDVDDLRADLLESMSKDVATRVALRELLRADRGRPLGDGADFVPRPQFGAATAGYIFELAYEELLADAAGRRALGSAYAKATSDDLRDVIRNFDEVRAWLRETAPCLVPHLEATDPGAVMASDCAGDFEDAINLRIKQSKSWRHARNNEVMELKVNATGNVGYKRSRAVTAEQFEFFQSRSRGHRTR
ncbi:hypothetical protein JL721_7513 [Aureococcus anophagefferens]|nr:hypothetical protein JL721_7513 [Aureococcus anophagefferens]